jgi:broad specificity phosphatase PhoE
MSSLMLVRHAQASFFADDYDRLSEVGRAQASLLGQHWVRRGLVVDEVYTGPRCRQQQTAELAGVVYGQAGARWPEPVVFPEFDEYDLVGLLHVLAPELARQDRAFAELMARYHQSEDDPSRARNFQKAFEALTGHWVTAGHLLTGLETWPAFRARVQRGMRRILERPGHGRRVAVFTSGGFIGTAVQLALDSPDRMALEMSWRIRNCALTEFVFTRERLTLDGFNAVPHLEKPELWTYR